MFVNRTGADIPASITNIDIDFKADRVQLTVVAGDDGFILKMTQEELDFLQGKLAAMFAYRTAAQGSGAIEIPEQLRTFP